MLICGNVFSISPEDLFVIDRCQLCRQYTMFPTTTRKRKLCFFGKTTLMFQHFPLCESAEQADSASFLS